MTHIVDSCVLTELAPSGVGLITLNRPKVLNALSLEMIRHLTRVLQDWRTDPAVKAVALRGMGKAGDGFAPFGAFCAGGDIRFFHQAALSGDPSLEAFFTEEYALNHLIHTYGKPCIALMDGVVMGGGMGISQGSTLRVVTERTQMAMPETRIGFFPDASGGYFLSRTSGRLGEWLALTGHLLKGSEAVAATLADGCVHSADLPRLWQHLIQTPWSEGEAAQDWMASQFIADDAVNVIDAKDQIEPVFSQPTIEQILSTLESLNTDWARQTMQELRACSPLMLHVTLEYIRRARNMGLAEELRMERDLSHHCFHLRSGAENETIEGIRALVVDKDQSPRWRPSCVKDITPDMVTPFFTSPWESTAHPLAML